MYVCAYTYIYNNNCSKLLTITLSPLLPPLSIHFTTYYKHLLSITIHKYPEWRLQHQGYAQVPYQEDAMLLSSSLSSPAPPWITLLSLRVLTLLTKIDLHMKNSKVCKSLIFFVLPPLLMNSNLYLKTKFFDIKEMHAFMLYMISSILSEWKIEILYFKLTERRGPKKNTLAHYEDMFYLIEQNQ